MHTCMHTYMNTYINICICMYVYTYIYILTYIPKSVCVCVCVYIYIYIYIYIHDSMCVRVCVCVCVGTTKRQSGRSASAERYSRYSKGGLLITSPSSPTDTTLRSSCDITASLTAPECRSAPECRYAVCPAPDTGPHSSLIIRATASLALVPAAAAHEK